jgi:toxin ParE1/3/4
MTQAHRYLSLLHKTMEAAAKHPLRGRGCDEIRRGYFGMPAGSHIVFYKRIRGGVDVNASCIKAWISTGIFRPEST